LTIGSHHPPDPLGAHAMLLVTAALFGLLAIALAIYGSYRFAVPLVRYLGEAGVNVLVRLSAFILVCIGVQIGWSGLSALLSGLQHPSGCLEDDVSPLIMKVTSCCTPIIIED
jgi:multiple antibiotic resistance protein